MSTKDILRVVLLIGCSLSMVAGNVNPQTRRHANSTRMSQDSEAEWQRIRKRYQDPQLASVLTSRMWSLIHNYESKEQLDRLMTLLISFSNAVEKNDRALLTSMGGIHGFSEQLVRLMKSGDEEVSGFSALVLAVCGDQSYGQYIAMLLNSRPTRRDEGDGRARTACGTGAIALGVLGAKRYVPRLLNLLASRNEYDRSGAVMGLAYLGDQSHAEAIASLLRNKQNRRDDARVVIQALFHLGVAANYTNEIADILVDEFPGDAGETAAYALAALGDKPHAKVIAKLLSSSSQKEYAAKSLAVMGAHEYTTEIATLLSDENTFTRAAAALSIGILNAQQYGSEVSKLLGEKEMFVRRNAAIALVLLDTREYADRVLPLIHDGSQLVFDPNGTEFDPLVEKQLAQIKTRFENALLRFKAEKHQ